MKRMLLILTGSFLVITGGQLLAEPAEQTNKWTNKLSALGIAKTSAIVSLGLWGLRNDQGNVLYHRSGFRFPKDGTKLYQLRPFVDVHYISWEPRDLHKCSGNLFKQFHIAHRATAGIAVGAGLYGLYNKYFNSKLSK